MLPDCVETGESLARQLNEVRAGSGWASGLPVRHQAFRARSRFYSVPLSCLVRISGRAGQAEGRGACKSSFVGGGQDPGAYSGYGHRSPRPKLRLFGPDVGRFIRSLCICCLAQPTSAGCKICKGVESQ